MDWVETFRQAYESIADHPRRVAASAMGVFWGAAAIVLTLSAGTGFVDYLLVEFSRYGKPALFVLPGVTSSGFPGHRPGVPVRFGREQALAVERDNTETVDAILAEHIAEERVLVEASGRVRRLDLTASDERFAHYRNFAVAEGRFLSATEVARAQPVAVVGHDAAVELFGDVRGAPGRSLRIDGQPFKVVGVFARKEGRQYMNTNRPDNRLLVVNITAAEERLGYDRDAVSAATVFVRDGTDSQAVLRSVKADFARRIGFHPDDGDALWTFNMAEILGSFGLMKIGLALFVGAAGTVTLLVGGIGIANYHLATLSERAVEIGVAKAIGARNRTLVVQSLVESVSVATTAGLLGVGLGLGITYLAARLIPPGLFPAPTFSPSVGIVALVALVGVTTIAALIPALRVRTMEISAALREG